MDGSSTPKDVNTGIKNVAPDAEKSLKQEAIPNYRQQRKIIKALLSENLKIPAEYDVPITQDERDEVLQSIGNNKIAKAQFASVLLSMEAPFDRADGSDDTDAIFPLVSPNEKMRAIIAGVVKGKMDTSPLIAALDLKELTKQFPEPASLEDLYSQYANLIPQETLRSFMKIVYGKRFEYWEQMKLLRDKAMEKYGAKKEEEIVPREIEGLEKMLLDESIGGNAGESRAGANAIYIKEDEKARFVFTNYPQQEYGRPIDVTFRVIFPKNLLDIVKRGEVIPPPLIESAEQVRNKSMQEEFNQRAKEHNAYKILNYLKLGGKRELLPYSPLSPNIDRLISDVKKATGNDFLDPSLIGPWKSVDFGK